MNIHFLSFLFVNRWSRNVLQSQGIFPQGCQCHQVYRQEGVSKQNQSVILSVILSIAKDLNTSTIGGQILHFVQDDKGEGVGK